MKTRILANFFAIAGITFLSAALVSGCSGKGIKLSKNAVPIDIKPSKSVYFYTAKSKMKNGALVVSGKLRVQNTKAQDVMGGHVHVQLMGPDGKILHESGVFQTPKVVKKTHEIKHMSKFHLTIPEKAPEGSKIVLQFHKNAPHAVARPRPH